MIRFINKLMLLCVAGLLIAGCNSMGMEQASDPWETGVDRDPSAKTLYTMGRILAAQGKDSQCEFVFKQAIAKDPKFVPAYVDLAEVYLRRDQAQQAMNTLQSALKHDPTSAILYNDIGMCWMLEGNYQRAIEYFSRASELDAKESRYHSNRAAALGMLGQYDLALAAYEKVLAPSDAHYNIAILSRARNDHARAEIEFERAAALADMSVKR